MIETIVRERAEATLYLTCEKCEDEVALSSLDPIKGQLVRHFTDTHHGHQPLIRIQ